MFYLGERIVVILAGIVLTIIGYYEIKDFVDDIKQARKVEKKSTQYIVLIIEIALASYLSLAYMLLFIVGIIAILSGILLF